ncbi:MAG TPA: Os1348 family NHLP clan protein, partial [Candidatus Limnocylindria bacterium]|nr:Os1348 family NHLP clan protein [Candidatus Limnocylindria bacterium]
MSKEAITKVVQRAISDAAFRRQLSTDPTGALRGFDLSAEETAAIRTGDAGRLSAMGVDQRMSKAFALGGATVGASRTAGSDLSNASSAMASEPTAARDGALVSGTLSENDALISDGASARSSIIPTEPHVLTADADGAVTSAARAISDDPDGFLAASDARASGEGDSGRSVIS